MTATFPGVRMSMERPTGGFAKSRRLVKHSGHADPHKQHLRAAGWLQKIASMIAFAMFIWVPLPSLPAKGFDAGKEGNDSSSEQLNPDVIESSSGTSLPDAEKEVLQLPVSYRKLRQRKAERKRTSSR